MTFSYYQIFQMLFNSPDIRGATAMLMNQSLSLMLRMLA